MTARTSLEVAICACAVGTALGWLNGDVVPMLFAGLIAVIGAMLTLLSLAIFRTWWIAITLLLFAWPAYGFATLFYQCAIGNCL